MSKTKTDIDWDGIKCASLCIGIYFGISVIGGMIVGLLMIWGRL
jgi:hypothetical protein